MGPLERRIKEGLGNLQPSPSLTPEPGFKVPETVKSGGEGSSLMAELLQSQLALWTLSLSSLFTWLWTSRKRCLLFNLFLLLPASLALTTLLSGALLIFVSLGRLLFPASGAESPVPAWVVKRLPQPASPPLLRRRRSQHSLRGRRHRSSAVEVTSESKASPSYFWQRNHSPPPPHPHRLSAHFRG